VAHQRKTSKTASQRGAITRLQNQIRNAVNVSHGRDRKVGVDPDKLKWAMRTYGIDITSLSLRAQRLPSDSTLQADYKLRRKGELLFRLKLVPWEDGPDARWHVKRHPGATWWRNPTQPRRRTRDALQPDEE